MSDYIEREAAQSAVWEEDNQTDMILAIGSLPAADVAPVRHAYWEFPIFTNSDDGLDPRVKCSECGSIEAAFVRWKYCPACGAKMDKEANT